MESSIAEFAALQATRSDIVRLKEILARERSNLDQGDEDYVADEDFHQTIAEITQNEVIVHMQKALWELRINSKMWQGYIYIFQIRVIAIFGYKIMKIL